MPTRHSFVCALLVVVATGLGACSAAHRPDPRESLPESLRDFHSQLIWGRYAEAAGYLPAGERAHFVGTYDDLEGELRFVEYELGSVDVDAVNNEAVVMVTLSWYRIPYYVVEETRIRETWSLDPENDYWWLVRREDPNVAATIDRPTDRADGADPL